MYGGFGVVEMYHCSLHITVCFCELVFVRTSSIRMSRKIIVTLMFDVSVA